VTVAVISVTSTMPVSGARTTPVKNAAMRHGESSGTMPRSGKREPAQSAEYRPSCAPSTSKGANNPPGVPAA